MFKDLHKKLSIDVFLNSLHSLVSYEGIDTFYILFNTILGCFSYWQWGRLFQLGNTLGQDYIFGQKYTKN